MCVFRTKRLIEERSLVTTTKGHVIEKIDIKVFDHTFDATLTLWGSVTPSASAWQASQTILLLTNAGLRDGQHSTILIEGKTHVDVDPCVPDASWLRDYVHRLIKREHVNLPFPRNGMRMFAMERYELTRVPQYLTWIHGSMLNRGCSLPWQISMTCKSSLF